MAILAPARRATIFLSLMSVCIAALSSCATAPAPQSRGAFRLTWIATRASDHTPLISASMTLAAGRSTTIRTDSTLPTEEKPAFPSFTASLSGTKTPGAFQLVTRASLREAARNKKGKLKVSKRNIGALIPIRAGETQLVSLPSDPVRLEVQLERR